MDHDVFLSYTDADRDAARTLDATLRRHGLKTWSIRDAVPGRLRQTELENAIRSSRTTAILVGPAGFGGWPEMEMRACLEIAVRHGRPIIPVYLPNAPADLELPSFLNLYVPVDLREDLRDDDGVHRLIAAIRLDDAEDATPVAPAADATVPVDVDVERLPTSGRVFVARENELAALDDTWDDANVNAITIVAWGGVGKSALVDRWLTAMAEREWNGAERVYGWSFYSQGTEDRLTSADAFVNEALKWFGDPNPTAGSARDRGLRLADLVRQRRTLLVLDGLEPLQHPPGPLAGRLKDPALSALVKSLGRTNKGLLVISTREAVDDLAHLEQRLVPRLDLGTFSDDDGAELLELLNVKGTKKERRTTTSTYGGHALALTLLGTYLVKACEGEIRQLPQVSFDVADEVAQGGHAWRVIAAYERWLGQRELAVLRLLAFFDRPADPDAIAVLRNEPVVPGLNDGLFLPKKRWWNWKREQISFQDWNTALSNLYDCGLLLKDNAEDSHENPSTPPAQGKREARPGLRGPATTPPLDAHPLIRAYFAHQLERHHPGAWQGGHERLYEHYKNVAPQLPDTLDDMMPLYAAVVHGCRAGKHQQAYDEVYRPRIRRGNEHYQLTKLGAFGADLVAVGSFFVRPWVEVAPELSDDIKAWLLNQAGALLRGLGRLTEAVQPMEVSGYMDVDRKNWKGAAISFSNVSELSLTLGNVTRAVTSGEESVELADKSGDTFIQMGCRVTLADELHYAGRWDEAAEAFAEAEALQAERQPSYPRLYSLQGYRYCDLLLGRPGPDAWSGLNGVGGDVQRLREACEDVRERATQTLEWAESQSLVATLEVALDNLSLGRSLFGLTLCLSPSPQSAPGRPLPPFTVEPKDQKRAPHADRGEMGARGTGGASLNNVAERARLHLDRAVDGLRAAGTEHRLPPGLLARAAFRRVHGERSSAEADLDEAREIAERGHMLLFLADAHLERTLLHLAFDENAEARVHLDAASEIIERCGYGRRRPDVEFLVGVLGER